MSTEETTVETNALTDRLRSRLALVPVPEQLRQVPEQLRQVPEQLRQVPAQLRQVPEKLRTRVRALVNAAGTRLRATLDLPTGTELQDLLARVEELDRRLDSLQTADVGVKKPAEPTPSKKKAANGVGKKTSKKAVAAKKAATPNKGRVKKIAHRAKAKKPGRSKR